MLIDWFTVVAQVGNFLILVWLLKRFLYKPILDAIDAREKQIQTDLADAEAKRVEAQKSQLDFASKTRAFDEACAGLLSDASAEAQAEGTRLREQVRQESVNARAVQQNALREEQQKIGDEITRLAATEVFEIVRKTLADLASVSLEERVSEVFNRRLHSLNGTAKDAIGAALKTVGEPAVIVSTFELPSSQRAAIQNALNESFSADIPVRFATGGAGICGIELTAHGQKVTWNISGYLAGLEGKVDELLRAQPEVSKVKPNIANDESPIKPAVEALAAAE